ncbi:MAG: ATP-binding protein [Spirochaetota bacterium]
MKGGRNRSIRSVLALLIVGTCTVIILLLNFTTRSVFNNQTQVMMQSTSRLIHASFDWAIAPLLAKGDIDDINRLLSSIGSERSVVTARIVAPSGRTIAESQSSDRMIRSPDLPLEELFTHRRLMLSSWNEDGYFSAMPVNGQDFSIERESSVVAVFVLGLRSSAYFDSYRPFIAAINAVTSVSILAFGTLLFLFIQRWFFRPLRNFTIAASQIRDGDYAARVSGKTPKEFQAFSEVFNRMAEEIAWKEAELETRVSSRTAEYKGALAKLEQTKDALIRQEKMASIGRLASGVAHEINNPIGYIQANLSAMSDYVADFRTMILAADSLVESMTAGDREGSAALSLAYATTRQEKDMDFLLEDIGLLVADSRKGAIRIGEIVQGLRAFARDDGGARRSCDINLILQSSLRMLESKLKYSCVVEQDLGALPLIDGNAGQLEQVFVNLLANAGDSIAKHGTIRLSSRVVGDSVAISVADNGSGIPAETIERIFEPFFTTKDIGEGTGLGLSISLGIVQKHGGRIDVESRVGTGTTFTVLLPLAQAGTGNKESE